MSEASTDSQIGEYDISVGVSGINASLLELPLLSCKVANEVAPFALKRLPAHAVKSFCDADHARAWLNAA